MPSSRRRLMRLAAATAPAALLLAACGDDDDGSAEIEEGLSGTIVISGSSTVEPISNLVAEEFQAVNPDVAISVDGPGTGDGFEQFCSDETDISDASRPIQDEEIAKCEENGVNFTELRVGFDGLSVITSTDNGDYECLAFEDLYALLGPESTGSEKWSDNDALAEEVGGRYQPYVTRPLVVTAPGEESGTYDTFVELVIEPIAEERGKEAAAREDYVASPNDNVIIEGVSGSDSSLGWVGFAYAQENSETITTLEVDGGEGCVAPSEETVADGSYPISRSLYIYVNNDKAAENDATAEFVSLYLSDLGLDELVAEAGYIPMDEGDAQETRDAWTGAGFEL